MRVFNFLFALLCSLPIFEVSYAKKFSNTEKIKCVLTKENPICIDDGFKENINQVIIKNGLKSFYNTLALCCGSPEQCPRSRVLELSKICNVCFGFVFTKDPSEHIPKFSWKNTCPEHVSLVVFESRRAHTIRDEDLNTLKSLFARCESLEMVNQLRLTQISGNSYIPENLAQLFSILGDCIKPPQKRLPNPRKAPDACGQVRSSYICDPSYVAKHLRYEIDFANYLLETLHKNITGLCSDACKLVSKANCSKYPASRLGLVLTDLMDNRYDSDTGALKAWKWGTCGNWLIIKLIFWCRMSIWNHKVCILMGVKTNMPDSMAMLGQCKNVDKVLVDSFRDLSDVSANNVIDRCLRYFDEYWECLKNAWVPQWLEIPESMIPDDQIFGYTYEQIGYMSIGSFITFLSACVLWRGVRNCPEEKDEYEEYDEEPPVAFKNAKKRRYYACKNKATEHVKTE